MAGKHSIHVEDKKKKSFSLEEKLSSNNNSLNLVRFVLASLVVFGHAFPLGGFTPIQIGGIILGAWHGTAVECFFSISGFLIFSSALRLNYKKYLWRRFLRIYPGYLVAIFVTGFIFAPLGAAFGAEWRFGEAVHFFFKSLTLRAGDLQVNADVPWSATWNGSLWTLFYEALAYIGACIFVNIPFIRKNLKISVVAIFSVSVLSYVLIPEEAYNILPGALATIFHSGLRLWTFFAAGMLFYVFASKIPSSLILSIITTLLSLLIVSTEHGKILTFISVILLTYSVLGLGASLKPKLFIKNDISYGVYVYAFPIQQLLILAGINQFGWLVTAFSCFVLTLPLAWLSWKLIESPALRLKNLV